MADPSVGIDWNTVGIVAGGFVGTAISALALRMGWKSGDKEVSHPTDTVEIKSAIIDSSSIKLLAAAIEGLSFTLLEIKKLTSDNTAETGELMNKLIDSIDNQTQEIRELSREVREHARELSKQPRM